MQIIMNRKGCAVHATCMLAARDASRALCAAHVHAVLTGGHRHRRALPGARMVPKLGLLQVLADRSSRAAPTPTSHTHPSRSRSQTHLRSDRMPAHDAACESSHTTDLRLQYRPRSGVGLRDS